MAFYLSKTFNILQRYYIKGYELDIYLEDYSIGIEYDGLFFHSKKENEKREQRKNEFYKKQGITIIHIKENKKKLGIEDNSIFFIP